MDTTNFPNAEKLQSIRQLWIGGAGFEVCRFLYDKDAGGRCGVEVTWRSCETGEEITYRFRGVVPQDLWPVQQSVVDVDNARVRQWDTPRPLRVTSGETGEVMFYASTIERN